MEPETSPSFLRSVFRILAPALGLFAFASAQLAAAVPAPPQISQSAAIQMEALKSIKKSSTPLHRKIDSRLYLGLLHRRNDARLTPLTHFRFVKPEADGRVGVDVLLDGVAGIKDVLNTIETLGGVVQGKSSTYLTIRARVHLEDLETIAARTHVRRVRQAIPMLTHATNVSEGDLTHGAQEARGFFGTIGTGVKVGVISDGVDSLAALQASGDLPPIVDVLAGQAGSGNEGAAMLEIVHDLAPGAALAFATAVTSEAQFAQNILDLAAAGCNVIVDDIIYLDESPFQDGPVAQAVNTVTANGVLYFSSAGNEGNADDGTSGTWEGDFLASAAPDPPPLAGANLHNFGDGGNSILVEFGGGNPPLLIWAEHYDLSTGIASTDFDIYDMDGGLTTIFDASTDVQDGAGGDDFAIEFIGGGTFSGERLLIDKFAAGSTSSVPELNLIVFRGELDDNLATRGATRGHSATAAAFSTAATPAAASFDGVTPDGPYPGPFTSANESESFTSDGPRRILLNADGSEITPGNRTSTGGVVRQKPDITAADGVSCAAPGFSTFYGTSAAAPHAAAIAALLKAAVPGVTPAQVRTAMIGSAIDIETAGVDPDTGAGIVMAHAVLQAGGAQPAAFLSMGAPVQTESFGDGDTYVEPNEIWNLSIPLTNNGGIPATGISALLSTSATGVTITGASSSYADLASAASGSNNTPFRFELAPDFACAGLIEFALDVSYGGGVPQTFLFSVLTGSPGTPATFTYSGAAVPIPDGADLSGGNPGAPVFANLSVPGGGVKIYKVALKIDGAMCNATPASTTVGIDHTFVNDLRITLHSPTGTAIQIIRNTDGGGNNFCQTLLDDAGTDGSIQAVLTAQAPFTGSFTPNAPLSAFAGEAAAGIWQLEAQDFFSQDIGNIRAFSIIITPAVCNVATLSPRPMAVDAHVAAGDSSNHNGVFEPGETVQVSPGWRNTSVATPLSFSGAASSFTGPVGPVYTLTDGTAAYGTLAAGTTGDCANAGGDCYLMMVTGARPAPHWDATFSESLSAGVSQAWTLHLGGSFPDAPTSHPFYAFIENIFHKGITGGCGGGNYCPSNSVNRAQMAVFLLKAKHGAAYVPPPCTGVFADVACSPVPAFAVNFIEQLAAENITGGCGGGNYCPNNPVTRAQMAVFLLKAEHGSAYVPPACTGVFGDVQCMPTPAFAVNFIEQLAAENITGGCGGGNYCPNNPNTRGQMAVFLVKTFGLQLFGQ